MGCGSKVKILVQKGNWSLIRRGTEKKHDYLAVENIEMTKDGTYGWDGHSGYWCPSKDPLEQIQSLASAIEYFRIRTEPNYIPRSRLEELVTLFKDGLIEDESEQAMIFFRETCEMEQNEYEYFGITKDDERIDWAFDEDGNLIDEKED